MHTHVCTRMCMPTHMHARDPFPLFPCFLHQAPQGPRGWGLSFNSTGTAIWGACGVMVAMRDHSVPTRASRCHHPVGGSVGGPTPGQGGPLSASASSPALSFLLSHKPLGTSGDGAAQLVQIGPLFGLGVVTQVAEGSKLVVVYTVVQPWRSPSSTSGAPHPHCSP